MTVLLSEHVEQPQAAPVKTNFPTLAAQALSEAEWARRRAEFEEEESESESERSGLLLSPVSPEEAGDEARRLDEAMLLRLKARE